MATVDIFHYNIFASILPKLSISLFLTLQGGLSWASFLFLWDRRKAQGSLSSLKANSLCGRGNDWEEAQGDFWGAENVLDLDLGSGCTRTHVCKFWQAKEYLYPLLYVCYTSRKILRKERRETGREG